MSDDGLVARIYKEFLHSVIQRQITQVKVGKRFKEAFLQRRYTNDQ